MPARSDAGSRAEDEGAGVETGAADDSADEDEGAPSGAGTATAMEAFWAIILTMAMNMACIGMPSEENWLVCAAVSWDPGEKEAEPAARAGEALLVAG